MRSKEWANKIFSISDDADFNKLAIDAFNYQHKYIPVYQEFCNKINIEPNEINHYSEIPYLPIEFFKTHRIVSPKANPQITFSSS